MQRALLSLWLVLASGCQSVQSVSISQIPARGQRQSRVVSEGSRPLIFAIPFGTSHIDSARSELLAQCPAGQIEGVLSKLETTNYFLGIVMVQRVAFEGYCIERGKKG